MRDSPQASLLENKFYEKRLRLSKEKAILNILKPKLKISQRLKKTPLCNLQLTAQQIISLSSRDSYQGTNLSYGRFRNQIQWELWWYVDRK